MIVIVGVTREVAHQIEMDGLLMLRAVEIEPIRDFGELDENLRPAARLFPDFS
jgi:hypothetical protein